MADKVSLVARSRNMAAIRSRDTKPELYLRKRLFAEGFRYRKYSKTIPGHPDLYLAKYHTAVFVNGCFWHRHQNCRYAYTPKSRTEYWETKFLQNIARDERVREELKRRGVKCLVVWECTIRDMKKMDSVAHSVINQIADFLNSSALYLEI